MTTLHDKAKRIFTEAQVITLASIDENGYPRPVPVVRLPSDDAVIYVSTGTSSAKTAHFSVCPKAGVSIVEGHNSIVYTGKVQIVSDQATKRALWSDWMSEHFTQGVDDPDYTILRFTPETAVYWIDGEFVKEQLPR